MRYRTSQLLAGLVILLLPLAAAAETSDGVKITADSIGYDKKDETYRASGKVRIEWNGAVLTSDGATLRDRDSQATATGNVLIEKGEDTLRADAVSLNLDTQLGQITNGALFIKRGNFRLSGAEMLKTGENDYRIKKGFFTTCDGQVPSWKFSASELDVTREEYAVGKNAVFYIKDIPVMYLPYIVYPVATERQSGFLIPSVGSRNGFFLQIPYYLVISPSQDFTFYSDVQPKKGVCLGADYRYILRAGSQGELKPYLIYDWDRDRVRGSLKGTHQQTLSPTLFFRTDLDMTLDRDFYEDYSEESGEYNRQYLESTAFLTKHWERHALTTEVKYYQDLYADTNGATLQSYPAITFTSFRQQVGATPFYLSFDANFTNFHREHGVKGVRFDLQPTLTYYATLGGILEGSAWFGYRERIYSTYGSNSGDSFDEMGLPVAGASISSTFSRVYDVAWGRMKKLKHIVIPQIDYTYMPYENQDQLPFFDYKDRLVPQNMVSYSITNYLTGKYLSDDGTPLYADLAYFRISQGYEISDSRRDVLAVVDDQRPFTDIRTEARINLLKRLSFDLDSRFNPYDVRFTTANTGISVSDNRGNSAGLSYRFSRNEVDYLEGRLTASYLHPFTFHYASRYSFDSGRFLESVYAMEYKQKCWSVILTYHDRIDKNNSFLVSFTLSGIGALGKVKAF